MISNVNFTGREAMLNQAMKPVATSSANYVSPSKVYSSIERIKSLFRHIKIADVSRKSDNAAASYAISHGTPKSAIVGINVDTIV